MATTHEDRLRELAYHGLLADPHGHATAACLAGAEALRLLREYQEATAAYRRACDAKYNTYEARDVMEAAELALLATETTR